MPAVRLTFARIESGGPSGQSTRQAWHVHFGNREENLDKVHSSDSRIAASRAEKLSPELLFRVGFGTVGLFLWVKTPVFHSSEILHTFVRRVVRLRSTYRFSKE